MRCLSKIILQFILLFSVVCSYAKNNNSFIIDSLNYENLPENELKTIQELSNTYFKSDNQLKKLDCIADITRNTSDLSIKLAYTKLLKQKLSEANITDKCKKGNLNILVNANLGESAYYNNKLDSAIILYETAMSMVTNCDTTQKKSLADIQGALAVFYGEKNKIGKSIDFFEKAISTLREIEDYENLGANLINLGLKQQELDNNKTAIQYIEEGLVYATKANSSLYIAHGLVSLGGIYEEQNHPLKCDSLCRLALKKLENINHDFIKMNCYVHLTSSNISLENYSDADFFADQAYKIASDFGVSNTINLILIEQAKSQLLQGYVNKAEKLAIEAMEWSNKNEFQSNKRYVAHILSDIYKAKKDWKNAYKMMSLYSKLNSELISNENKILSNKQVLKYEYEKQKAIDEIKTKEAINVINVEKEKNTIALYATIVICLLISIASVIIYNRLRYIKKQKVELDKAYVQLEENKKTELIASNLKALQSQMNPHFIFNALNSVQDLVLFKDIRNSNKYLGKFSDLIRKILTSSRKQFINLYEEIEILQLYLDLEKLRFGDDLAIEFTCNVSEEKQEQINLPAMFIQPHVENAIKHGLFNKEGHKKLMINFSLAKNNYLKCVIEDNGIGQEMAQYFKQKNEHLHTGFSTEATNERIFLLNQSLDRKIDYQIEDLKEGNTPKGTRVIILFPI